MTTHAWVDDWDYINYSKAIFNGVFLHSDIDQQESDDYRIDEIPPLYPIILALFFKIVGYSNLHMIIWLNIIVNILIIYLLFLIGRSMIKGNLALLAAFLWSIYIDSLVLTGRVLKEPFITLFILLIVFLIHKLNRNFNYKYIMGLAIVSAVFAHLDERYLFMTGISFIFALVIALRRGGISTIWRSSILYVAMSLIIYTPWMIRNYQRYDKAVLITPRTSFVTDKLFGYKNRGKAIEDLTSYVSPAQVDSIVNGYQLASVDSFTQSNIRTSHRNGLKPHAFNMGEKILYNTTGFWQLFSLKPFLVGSGYKYSFYWGIKHNFFVIIEFTLFLFISLYGFYLGIKRKHLLLLLFLSILLINTIQHVILGAGICRYRSVMDTLIFLAAGYAIEQYFIQYRLKHPAKKN